MRWLTCALAVLFLLTGCSQISAQMDGAQTSTPSEGAALDPNGGPILVTQAWGVVDGMLSVEVRNTSKRTLRFATAVITARDDQDVLVTSSTRVDDGTCCDVVDLPAGDKFGFYLDVGSSTSAISQIDVVYQDVAWSPAAGKPATTFVATPKRIDSNSIGAVVVADVRTAGDQVAQANAQAFLTDEDGTFLAVVSGRWDCFTAGSRQIRMQLFHPVPEGTKVESVVLHPVEHDPARPSPACGSTDAS